MTTTTSELLFSEKQHLANLLEAIQRCVYFLNASQNSIAWPLTGTLLTLQKKDNDLFEALCAINERFAKLQDTLGSHAPLPVTLGRTGGQLHQSSGYLRKKTGHSFR